MKLRFVVEHEPLGTAGGIRFAAEGIDERLLVCNGDVLTDLDLGDVRRVPRGARAPRRRSALTQVDDPSAFGVVPTRADGEVVAFVEKPPRGQAPTNWINAGTYVLEPVGARIDPAAAQRLDRARDVPADARGARAASTRCSPTPTGSTSAPRRSTSRPSSTCSPGGSGAAPTPGAVETGAGRLGRARRRDRRRAATIVGAVGRSAPGRTRSEPGRRRRRGVRCSVPACTTRRRRAGVRLAGARWCFGARRSLRHDREVTDEVVGPRGAGCPASYRRRRREGARHRRRRVHRLDARRPAARRGLGRRRRRRPLDRQPRRTSPTPASLGSRKFSFHRLDVRSPAITDLIAHRKPDVVFHLAAQADVRVSVARPLFDAEVNILGTLNVCQGALAAGTQKVVFAALGRHALRHPRAPAGPRGAPAAARVAVRRREEGRRATTSTTTARSTGSSTPRSRSPTSTARARTRTARPASSSIFAGMMLERRGRRSSATAKQTRDFVFVDDVVDALVPRVGPGRRPASSTSAPASRRASRSSTTRWPGAIGYDEPPNHAPARAGRARSARRSTRAGPRSTSAGSRGPTLDDGVDRTLDWFQAQRHRPLARLALAERAELVERDRRAGPADVRRIGVTHEHAARGGATRPGARARRAPASGQKIGAATQHDASPASAAASMRFSTAAPSDSSAMPHSARWRVGSG